MHSTKRALTLLLALMIALPALASLSPDGGSDPNYLMRHSVVEQLPTWESAEPLTGEWENVGSPQCNDWSPSTDTVSSSETLVQFRDCTQDQERATYEREVESDSGKYRTIDESIETRVADTSESRNVQGTSAAECRPYSSDYKVYYYPYTSSISINWNYYKPMHYENNTTFSTFQWNHDGYKYSRGEFAETIYKNGHYHEYYDICREPL